MDDLDRIIAERAAHDPTFPDLVEEQYQHRLKRAKRALARAQARHVADSAVVDEQGNEWLRAHG